MRPNKTSLIAIETFIQATRDSGYRGTASAMAEIVDNSLQAGAETISITFDDSQEEQSVSVHDDGAGMDAQTLRQALRFGGSSRFGDRRGLGRYGMGLPNASLSQARRLEVYTRQANKPTLYSYLDVDEIAAGELWEVPEPIEQDPPESLSLGEEGTIVIWRRCDRLDNVRASTNARKVRAALGRVFRHFLWRGVNVAVNGEEVEPIDPLFLEGLPLSEGELSSDWCSDDVRDAYAEIFGEEIVYEVQAPPGAPQPGAVGFVTVTFTELPVHAWHGLPNKVKRRLGISKGAGVSVVRGFREIEYGWHFLSGKRRENYDDWWRCEVRFDPILDEAFGITHTKQQIRPMEYLTSLLSADLETLARALNARVRSSHTKIKANERFAESERVAAKQSALIGPPRQEPSETQARAYSSLSTRNPSLAAAQEAPYRIVEDTISDRDTSFFGVARNDEQIIAAINPEHMFYKRVYAPLLEDKAVSAKALRGQLELLLLSASRAMADARAEDEAAIEALRQRWSDILSTFLKGRT